MITGFVQASSMPDAHQAALEKIREHHPKTVRHVWTTTGRYNLLLRVQADTAEEMTDFIFRSLHEMKDIQSTLVFFPARSEIKDAPRPPVTNGKGGRKA